MFVCRCQSLFANQLLPVSSVASSACNRSGLAGQPSAGSGKANQTNGQLTRHGTFLEKLYSLVSEVAGGARNRFGLAGQLLAEPGRACQTNGQLSKYGTFSHRSCTASSVRWWVGRATGLAFAGGVFSRLVRAKQTNDQIHWRSHFEFLHVTALEPKGFFRATQILSKAFLNRINCLELRSQLGHKKSLAQNKTHWKAFLSNIKSLATVYSFSGNAQCL